MKRHFKAKTRQSGQSLVELATGLIIAIPIMLALMDCCVLVIGAAAADTMCRDAARAAASGPPGQMTAGQHDVGPSEEPHKRAKSVMEKIYNLGIPVKLPPDGIKVKEQLENPLPDATTGGAINGTVVVNSTVNVYPPFIVGVVLQHSIDMKSRHGFPFTYVVRPSGPVEP